MTIRLQLPPELSERLLAGAARRRQTVEEYILALVERTDVDLDPIETELSVDTPVSEMPGWDEVIRRAKTGYQPGEEERRRALRELIQGVHTGVSLTDEELSREAIYNGR